MSNIYIYIMTLLGVVGYQVMLKILGAGKENFYVVMLILYSSAILFSTVFYLITSTNTAKFNISSSTIFMSVLLGVFTFLVEFGYLHAFRANMNLSTYGMSVMISSIVSIMFIGALFFNEQLSFIKIIGAVFCITGVVLIRI